MVYVVRAIRPVPYLGILGVATEADAVSVARWTLMEANDLALVATTCNVKTAVSVAVFALDPLLGVVGVAISGRVLRVTGGAHLGTGARRTCDLYVLSVGLDPVCGVLRGR
jgi:hypothetical protein